MIHILDAFTPMNTNEGILKLLLRFNSNLFIHCMFPSLLCAHMFPRGSGWHSREAGFSTKEGISTPQQKSLVEIMCMYLTLSQKTQARCFLWMCDLQKYFR